MKWPFSGNQRDQNESQSPLIEPCYGLENVRYLNRFVKTKFHHSLEILVTLIL